MGREVVGLRTRHVSAPICCLTYIAAYATIGLVFIMKPYESQYLNGISAHVASTLVIFLFSIAFGNSSLYDPAWAWLAVPMAGGWLLTGDGLDTRGIVAFVLTFLWAFRFMYQWPWEGWFHGVKHEDWRYVDFDQKVGGNSFLYWPISLIGFHLFPTLLVYFGLAPVERVWTAGTKGPELGPADAVAFTVTFIAIVIAFVADKQLSDFRLKDYGKGANLDQAAGSKKPFDGGLWRYSRHPNYFGEILFWVGMAMIAYAGDPQPDKTQWYEIWSGAILMWGLFQFYSVPAMDERNLKNRQGYDRIMREVSPLILWPPSSSGKKE